ncbi:hypothetical protein DIPPA_00621 [Diplonema papillatum]|nr:hypothetical protein DIPPA_00621 [Diplonema papillatum]
MAEASCSPRSLPPAGEGQLEPTAKAPSPSVVDCGASEAEPALGAQDNEVTGALHLTGPAQHDIEPPPSTAAPVAQSKVVAMTQLPVEMNSVGTVWIRDESSMPGSALPDNDGWSTWIRGKDLETKDLTVPAEKAKRAKEVEPAMESTPGLVKLFESAPMGTWIGDSAAKGLATEVDEPEPVLDAALGFELASEPLESDCWDPRMEDNQPAAAEEDPVANDPPLLPKHESEPAVLTTHTMVKPFDSARLGAWIRGNAVTNVVSGGIADEAGLKVGMRIVQLNDEPVDPATVSAKLRKAWRETGIVVMVVEQQPEGPRSKRSLAKARARRRNKEQALIVSEFVVKMMNEDSGEDEPPDLSDGTLPDDAGR